MAVFAYHTPYLPSPINDKRAGTIRTGSDDQSPIQIMKGWDAALYFSFKDQSSRAFITEGREIKAQLLNQKSTELYSTSLIGDPINLSSGRFIIPRLVTDAIEPGYYNLIISYLSDFNTRLPMSTSRSVPRFMIDIIGITNGEIPVAVASAPVTPLPPPDPPEGGSLPVGG